MGQAKAQVQWEDTQHEQLLADIAQAHREWTIAMEHFNNATVSEVVDDAIYLLIAAERRYEGLMRIARRQNLCVDLHGRVGVVPSSFVAAGAQTRTGRPTESGAALGDDSDLSV